MNLVTITAGNLYPEQAASRQLGPDHYEAYMVIGRTGSEAAVITGAGAEERVAIEMMVRKLKMLREQFDLMCHEAFWQHMEREAEARLQQLREQLGMPTPSKKTDDGGLS